MFQKFISKKKLEMRDMLILSLIFGIIGIIGTYTGIHIQGAIANARVIGVFVGGLLGGPVVGLVSGLIAGGHRLVSDIGGFTALACSISTVVEGLMGGFLKKKYDESKHKFFFSFIFGVLAEIIQMLIILLVARPYGEALELVKVIGFPMIIANAIGIAVFMSIAESILKEIENESAHQAQLALKIADKTLKYSRKGYNRETAEKIAYIIKENVELDAIAFTDRDKIIAHVGVGEDHHKYGIPLQTEVTKRAIDMGVYQISNTKEEISCLDENCKLKSAIIVPLKEGDRVIGAMKLYKAKENAITKVQVELALGLAQILSTQIELGKIEYQKELVSRSELKALQAQINPHFLFNALNTISSMIRTKPDEAKLVVNHLGQYFRNNLNSNLNDIPLIEEVENVKSYIAIEKARFGDRLNVVYDIPDNIDCDLPALIIQPLVENAVKHGICNSLKGGSVEIIARNKPKHTHILVRDNGVGMEDKLISYLLSEEEVTDRIGIRNVNERLKNKYGDPYGLQIFSRLGEGTQVNIYIPK